MVLTTRLSLHKPSATSEPFGDYFPTNYAADLQQIDDEVQIKNLAAAGHIPVYDDDGLLISSGIEPSEIEVGLLDSILDEQGKLLYRNATALAALSPDTDGKSLLTKGPGANPIFGYPAHGTLTGLTSGDPHTQYVLRSLLSYRGGMPFYGVAGWEQLVKGTAGNFLKQGANDPTWAAIAPADTNFAATLKILGRKTTGAGAGEECSLSEILDFIGSATWGDLLTRGETGWIRTGKGTPGQRLVQGTNVAAWTTAQFNVAFPFGDGTTVLLASSCEYEIPIACKITAARIWEVNQVAGSLVTCTLYKHALGAAKGSVIDVFAITTSTSMEETGLNISVSAGEILRIDISGITNAKQIVCNLRLEAT